MITTASASSPLDRPHVAIGTPLALTPLLEVSDEPNRCGPAGPEFVHGCAGEHGNLGWFRPADVAQTQFPYPSTGGPHSLAQGTDGHGPACADPVPFSDRTCLEAGGGLSQADNATLALRMLEPYFKHANRVLQGTALGRWPDRAAIIGRGPVLKRPSVPADVQEVVYTALRDNQKVDVPYRSKVRTGPERIVPNPLGIVVRAGIIYLVATSWEYDDIRQYVLHRMGKPEPLDEPTPEMPDFRLAG